MDAKFKSDPYNPLNRTIQESDVLNIMNTLNLSDHRVNDISLYQTAFVHKSYTNLKDYEEYAKPDDCLELFHKSYETMEFLGDSLLGSIVSTYLYERYIPFEVDEGFLTKLKIRLVCGEQLGYLADCLGFAKYMVISKHIDESCRGRENVHILEDIFEAFLGSLYLDTGNLTIVKEFVIRTIEKYVDIVDLISRDNNYKDQILRYFQHNFKVHPIYETSEDPDDPNQGFRCCILKDSLKVSEGRGTTKKKAEQDASRNALISFHVISD